VAALLLTFSFIAAAVMEGATLKFDRYVMFAFRSSANDFSAPVGPLWVQEMARDVTALGSFSVLGLLLVSVTGYLLLIRKREQALLVLVAVLGGVVVNSVLKLAFGRPRQDLFAPAARVFTASFPSDHAALSAIAYMTLAALLARTIASRPVRIYLIAVAITLVVLIGASRLYLGVHYPTDILAGWCVGSAWALACWALMTRLRPGYASSHRTMAP
jgi:Membrane-associated phospholipid phosphatase